MIFCVCLVFLYRPTDLSLLKEFSKNVIFSNSYNLPSQSAIDLVCHPEALDIHALYYLQTKWF